MKRSIILFLLVFAFEVSAQNDTEFSLAINTGLFAFNGVSTAAESGIINNYFSPAETKIYVLNPYGSLPDIGFGFTGNVKSISSVNFILGLEAGFEFLRSKSRIDKVYNMNGLGTSDAKGIANLKMGTLNFNPYLGYRINDKWDALFGIDLAYLSSSKEKSRAETSEGLVITTDVDRKTIKWDSRLRIQLTRNFGKFNHFVSFSHGISNYKSGYKGGPIGAYSNVLRIGASYLPFN